MTEVLEKVVEVQTPKTQVVQPSLFNLGERLGKLLNEAVTDATELAISQSIQPVQVVLPETKEMREVSGYSHEKTPTILRILSARLPLFLVGEAGSGKTHLVEQCA